MPFNPQIDSTSAQFIFGGLNRQTDATERRREIQGAQNQQNLEMAGDAAMKYFQQAQETNEERDLLRTKMEMFADSGTIDGATFEKFSKGSIGSQRAMASIAETAWARNLKADQQANPNVADLSGMGADYLLVNGMALPKQGAKEPRAQARDVRQAADGSFVVIDPNTGQAAPVTMGGAPVQGMVRLDEEQAVQAKADAETAAKIQNEILRLEKEIQSRGPDAKRGPNFNPFATTLGEQLEEQMAKLRVQQAKMGAAAPGMPAAGGGMQPAMPGAMPARQAPQLPPGTVVRQGGREYVIDANGNAQPR